MKDFYSFFTEASCKVKTKLNLRREPCITALVLKSHEIFLFISFLLKLHEKSRKKINSSRKWCITAWALKSYERFLTVFYRSFMKSQDQIKLEENIVSQLGLPKILGCHASNSQLEIGPKHEDMPSFKSIRGCFNTSAVPQGRLAYL